MEHQHLQHGDFTQEQFMKAFNKDGYVIVDNALSAEYVDALVPELEQAIEEEAEFRGMGKDYREYGMLPACPVYGGKFLDVAGNEEFMKPFDWILGDQCIMWVYTSSSMPPGNGNYSSYIHADRPHYIPGYIEGVGSLTLLTDFTLENGATYLLPGSHTMKEAPDEDYFYENAVRLVGKKGATIYFHLRLWHAGGENKSNAWRHMIGIGMVRPYLKQRIDLPRAMRSRSVDISQLSDFAKQKLGFMAQPPSSLEEFFGKGVEKTYTQKSEWKEKGR